MFEWLIIFLFGFLLDFFKKKLIKGINVPKKRIKMNFKPYHVKKLASKSVKPLPRSGHRIVADESYLYSYGGYNPNNRIPDEDGHIGPILCELWRYHFFTDTWQQISTTGPKPREAASHSMVLDCKNVLLVFGGTGQPFGEVRNNTLSAYNIKSNLWTTVKTKGTPPDQRYGQALAVYNNDVYVSGGTNGFDYYLDLFKLDLKTKEWSKLNEPSIDIPGRYRHEIAIYEDKIYVIGGGTSLEPFSLTEIPVYDLNTDKWSLVKTISDSQHGSPRTRQYNSCLQNDKFVYIAGGFSGFVLLSDIWVLELPSLTWNYFLPSSLNKGLQFHAAALSHDGSCMYVFGGLVSMTQRTNVLTEVGLKVSSLKEITWRTVCKLFPTMNSKIAKHILNIPPPFLQRI